jgi:hypothetical protein
LISPLVAVGKWSNGETVGVDIMRKHGIEVGKGQIECYSIHGGLSLVLRYGGRGSGRAACAARGIQRRVEQTLSGHGAMRRRTVLVSHLR